MATAVTATAMAAASSDPAPPSPESFPQGSVFEGRVALFLDDSPLTEVARQVWSRNGGTVCTQLDEAEFVFSNSCSDARTNKLLRSAQVRQGELTVFRPHFVLDYVSNPVSHLVYELGKYTLCLPLEEQLALEESTIAQPTASTATSGQPKQPQEEQTTSSAAPGQSQQGRNRRKQPKLHQDEPMDDGRERAWKCLGQHRTVANHSAADVPHLLDLDMQPQPAELFVIGQEPWHVTMAQQST